MIWLEFDSQASKLPRLFGWMACVHREGILQASLIPKPVVEMSSSGCEYGTILSLMGLISPKMPNCEYGEYVL